MDVAFLPAGLLESEGQVDRAKPLGVRDFTVDNVLDRMRGASRADADPWDGARVSVVACSRESDAASSAHSVRRRSCERVQPGDLLLVSSRPRRRLALRPIASVVAGCFAETLLPDTDGAWRPASAAGVRRLVGGVARERRVRAATPPLTQLGRAAIAH